LRFRGALAYICGYSPLYTDGMDVAVTDLRAHLSDWLERAVEQSAGQLAVRHALRGADAVHLASAQAAGLAVTPAGPAT